MEALPMGDLGSHQTGISLSDTPLHIRIIEAAYLFSTAGMAVPAFLDVQRTARDRFPGIAKPIILATVIGLTSYFCLLLVPGLIVLLEPYSRHARDLQTRVEARRYRMRYTLWIVRERLRYKLVYIWWIVREYLPYMLAYTRWKVRYIIWHTLDFLRRCQ
ncbi:hypothetical protein F5B18DRAFT_620238 [Nemania serpens]|nr:hypothetical protein F5B18DRAFT_620238 [Nemania serpens]